MRACVRVVVDVCVSVVDVCVHLVCARVSLCVVPLFLIKLYEINPLTEKLNSSWVHSIYEDDERVRKNKHLCFHLFKHTHRERFC